MSGVPLVWGLGPFAKGGLAPAGGFMGPVRPDSGACWTGQGWPLSPVVGQNFLAYPETGGSPVWGPAGFIRLGPPACPGWF